MVPVGTRALRYCALVVALIGTGPVAAEDLQLQPGAAADDIAAMAKDLSVAYAYKAVGPAEAFGTVGFGIGTFATRVGVDDEGAWQRAGGTDTDTLYAYGLRARKGLPLGIDVSAFYADVPSSDARVIGGALQYALLEGSAVTPGVAVRAGYSRLDGINDFDFDALSLDATVSKGFAILTPYAGVGYVRGEIDPKVGTLDRESVDRARVFGGMRVSLGLLDITPEIEQSGGSTVANLRLGVTL